MSYSRVLGANDRVRMGFIGVGNHGGKVHEAFVEWGDSQTVAIHRSQRPRSDSGGDHGNAARANNPLNRNTQRRRGGDYKMLVEAKAVKGSFWTDAPHARNFLDCVKSRETCHADSLTGHRSTSATVIANIAPRTESLLKWDAQAERFTNKAAANKWLHYQYRPPFELAV